MNCSVHGKTPCTCSNNKKECSGCHKDTCACGKGACGSCGCGKCSKKMAK